MANAKLIDKINDAFLDIMVEENAEGFKQYITNINRQFINNIDSLDATKVRSIISSNKLNVDNTVLLFAIQNAVLLILADRNRAKKKESLLPVLAIMGLYSINKPKRFVRKIVKITKGVGLNTNELKAKKAIDSFNKVNNNALVRARKIAIERTEVSIVKSKRNKRMIRDFKRFEQQGDSVAKIKNKLVRKYNKLSNVERVLETELHAQAELVRIEHSKSVGFTHKTWKTQGDSKVRKTCFHNAIANKRIPIDSDYRACGMRASQPSDSRLPPQESIRCRCYNVYD